MIIGDAPCPSCRSQGRDSTGNHLILFENGNKYCNRCGYKEIVSGNKEEEEYPLNTIESIKKLPTLDIPERGLKKDFLEEYGIKTSVDPETGEVAEAFFPVYSNGKLSGYKVRPLKEKKFFKAAGSLKDAELFGQHKFSGGRFIIVTEGEFDAVAMRQMLHNEGKNYRVVSLPNGANASDFARNIEYLNSFDTVVLAFDQDEPGQKAALACAEMLKPGAARIMSMPEKDANDCLQSGVTILRHLNNAKPYQNDSIISVADAFSEAMSREPIASLPYPEGWDELNRLTRGIRLGEIDTWVAGTGSGKSSFIRELIYNIVQTEAGNVAILSVEEDEATIASDLIGLHVGRRLRFREELEAAPKDKIDEAINLFKDRVHILKTEAIAQADNFSGLLDKLRYMYHYLDCRYFFLDHAHGIVLDITNKSSDDGSGIDQLVGGLNRLKKELGIYINLIAHTRKTGTGGGSFEEGDVPSPDDIKGSGSIKQYSSGIFALSRNRLDPDPYVRNTTMITVWKCRFTGQTGHADKLHYNSHGRLEPANFEEEAEEEL